MGQSGSGKSTLVKLLPRLYSPNAGRLLIDEYDIDKVEANEIGEEGIVSKIEIHNKRDDYLLIFEFQ